jgi:uncharacterized protein YecT (DUF1311 family)
MMRIRTKGFDTTFREFTPLRAHNLMPFLAIVIISVVSLLLPLAPLHAQTQSAMNTQASAEFQRTDADLNKTYQSVLAKLPTVESKENLGEEQRAWVVSRDPEAARVAKETDGGSMAPTLRYETMTRLTRDRIKKLNNMLDHGIQNGGKLAASSATTSPSSTPESTSEQAQAVSKTGHTSTSSARSVSPDKQWEYKCDEYYSGSCAPKIVKAGTGEVVLDLGEDLTVHEGEAGDAEVIWAADSKRFAFNYSPVHAHHTVFQSVAFYQLRGDKWLALRSPGTKHHSASSWRNLARAICQRILIRAVARRSATF